MNSLEIQCSIIIPVYSNESTLNELFYIIKEKVISVNSDLRFEIIFIDDGSGDNSFQEIVKIKRDNPELVKIIKFTRNFGQVSALFAGYQKAKGDCVINISADLQDPPELMNEMLSEYYDQNQNYKIVICSRAGRDESIYRTKTSHFFYKIIRTLTFRNMPEGGFDYVLLSKEVINYGLIHSESNPFWQGQILWTGFSTKIIEYRRRKRKNGKSGWSFAKKIKYLIDGILSYSYFPIRLMSILGIIIALFGFIYAIIIVIERFLGNVPFKGWAPIMVLVLILSGIQMLMLGIIGEYLWRTLEQVRKRPSFIIERIID